MAKSPVSTDESEDDSFNLDMFDSEEDLASPFAGPADCPHLYEHHLHTVCALAIKCQHDAMPLSALRPSSKAGGFWLPYVSVNLCYAYEKVAAHMSEFFLKQLGLPCELKKLLDGSMPLLFEKIVLHTIHRIQIPNGEFIERIIYMARWKSSDTNCCKNTPKVKWIPVSVAREQVGNNSGDMASPYAELIGRFWGSEVAEYAKLFDKKIVKLLDVTEQTTDQVFKYINSPDAPPKIVQFVAESKFTEADVTKVYCDFVQHCFPSSNMSFASFADYFAKVGLALHLDERSLRATFRAMNYKTKGYLTFNEFLLGIIALDPASPNTATRHSFIFRYYDHDSDGTLDAADVRQLATDLKQPPEQWENKLKSFDDFVAEIESTRLQDTKQLCRAKQPIVRLMHSSSAYELITNRYGRPFSKQLQPTCSKCRPKNYQLAAHSVRLTKAGRVEEPQTVLSPGDHVSMLNLSEDSRLPIFARRIHSYEFVFKPTSSANCVLNLIRQMVGFKEMPEAKQKEVSAQVAEGLNLNLLMALCNEVTEVLSAESRVLSVSTPCYVLGDIHGNLSDLLTFEGQLWPMAPACQAQNVLFLGDYVDRGEFSLEVACYLFAMKVLAPTRFFLLRGNHELRQIQQAFTFEKECKDKYNANGQQVFETINRVFDTLPFAAVIDEQIFCAHGGIPSSMSQMTKLDALCRLPITIEDPQKDAPAVWEILWADPIESAEVKKMTDFARKKGNEEAGFLENLKRSTGYYFTETATNNFLAANSLSHIIRAHEVVDSGYKFNHSGRVLTVFSSSRYCNGTNKAAAILVEAFSNEGYIKILQLETN